MIFSGHKLKIFVRYDLFEKWQQWFFSHIFFTNFFFTMFEIFFEKMKLLLTLAALTIFCPKSIWDKYNNFFQTLCSKCYFEHLFNLHLLFVDALGFRKWFLFLIGTFISWKKSKSKRWLLRATEVEKKCSLIRLCSSKKKHVSKWSCLIMVGVGKMPCLKWSCIIIVDVGNMSCLILVDVGKMSCLKMVMPQNGHVSKWSCLKMVVVG